MILPVSADSSPVDFITRIIPRERVFQETARVILTAASELVSSGMPLEDVLTLVPECLRDEFPVSTDLTPVVVPVGMGHVICYTGGEPVSGDILELFPRTCTDP
jgi:hypothetical protein